MRNCKELDLNKKGICYLSKFYENNNLFFLLIVLLIMACIVYAPFIFGGKFYYFVNDVASDSYQQTYPMYEVVSNNVKNGLYPTWDFSVGLGQNIYASSLSFGDPLNSLMLLFGSSGILYLSGPLQVLKCVLAGLFFYLYIKKMLGSKHVAFIVAICYAFCGHIIARGFWVSYPNEVVWVAFVLFAFERLFKDKKWGLFPVSLAILFLSLKGYQTLVYSLWLVIYVVLRYFVCRSFCWKEFLLYLAKVAGLYFLALGISAVIVLPNLLYSLNSPRVSGGYSQIENLKNLPIWTVTSFPQLAAAFLRTLNPDILGNANQYGAPYLEYPLLYCGVLSALLFPQAFLLKDKRKRNAFIVLAVIAFLYIFFVYFRSLMNGMMGTYYKHGSFFIVITMLVMTAYALNDIFVHKTIHKRMLILTLVLQAGIGALLFYLSKASYIELGILVGVVLQIAFYIIWFCLLEKKKISFKLFFAGLCAITILFTTACAYYTVNYNRDPFGIDYLQEEKGYFDKTGEAIEFTKEIDNSIYRMEIEDVQPNDSMVRNYMGITEYYDIPDAYYNFLYNLGCGLNYKIKNIVEDYSQRNNVFSLMAGKYYISSNEKLERGGYKLVANQGGEFIYENTWSMPFGFLYESYIPIEEFDQLSLLEKDNIIVNSFVSDQARVMEQYPLEEIGHIEPVIIDVISYINMEEILGNLETELSFKSVNNDPEIILNCDLSDNIVSVEFDMFVNTPGYGEIFWAENSNFNQEDSLTFYQSRGLFHYSFLLENKEGNTLRIDPINRNRNVEIKNMKITSMPQSDYYENSQKAALRASDNQFNITFFSNTKIEGEVKAQGDRMLFLPILYDDGWKAYVNGKHVDAEKINFGFMGIPISAGVHDIVLEYQPPYALMSVAITLFSLGLHMILLLVHIKKQNSHKEE